MEEIIKHINDTNASYRDISAGDAKNTDLFLDQEHKQFFNGYSTIHVVFNKTNLMQAILFIASILPRKYDRSSEHYKVSFTTDFIYDNLLKLEGLFAGKDSFGMDWSIRTGVPQKNGKIDDRFYLNGLIHEYTYTNRNGFVNTAKFTVRDYLAGGYSDIHFRKTDYPGTYDCFITNTTIYDNEIDDDQNEIDVTASTALQQIYYGAPGTGKSYTINRQTAGESVIRTTFHPDSDYSTFVGAYKPTTREVELRDVSGHKIVENGSVVREERIIYEFVGQAFLQAYVNAWKLYAANTEEPAKQYLVIEEINRGNCAQIFGDLFQLLDRNDYGFSDYPIAADNDLSKYLRNKFAGLTISNADSINTMYKGRDVVSEILSGKILILPNNLYIWATMNTSDQSLFPIDSAFKRRWEWKYIPIDTEKDKWTISVNGKSYSWSSFLNKINNEIDITTHSEDKKLGFYFCKSTDGVISAERFVGKVLFYLYNDVFRDYGFARDFFKDGTGQIIPFQKFFNCTDGSTNEYVVEIILKNLGVELMADAAAAAAPQNNTEEAPADDLLDEDGNTAAMNANDRSKYAVNGVGAYGKGNVAYQVLKQYVAMYPQKTALEVANDWMALGIEKVPNFFETQSVHEIRRQKASDVRFDRRSESVTLADGQKIYVSNQYTQERIDEVMTKINAANWGITISKL